eukprot:TRINITY_DN74560_c0_g1_i1.p1 TRINITY_DN74560_c0_g1~~TRINITY_DN74560_c0_g1_i1.p1  ORF type:complete len:738 (+),score=56.06 TRINITY_DN74560_c0_g1_i1:3-2216(+)
MLLCFCCTVRRSGCLFTMTLRVVLLVMMTFCVSGDQVLKDVATCDGVFFSTFNIQNFGVSKASRPAVLSALAQTIRHYDIVAIQEISQMPSGNGVCGTYTMSAICDLLSAVKAAGSQNHRLAISPRIGDEQYALIYNASKVVFVAESTYPDPDGKHSRPPHAFHLSVGSVSLVIALTHTRPTDATVEIQNFPNVLTWLQSEFGNRHMMIVGDFNADGTYFDEDSDWPGVLARMPGYTLRTGNELDTTVAKSSNAYDRIIADERLQADVAKVFVIEKHVNLSHVLVEGCRDGYVANSVCSASDIDWSELTKELSDHYPVEMCLHLARNSTLVNANSTTSTTTETESLSQPVPGDCAIIGMHADNPDDFGILMLADIRAGEKIFATDNGILGDGSLRRTEGIISYTPASVLPAGTVLTQANFSTVEEGSFSLSSSGDQLIVFIGSISSPEYICALNNEGSAVWQSAASSAATSALPQGLVNGVDAVALDEADNVAYAGPLNGTAISLRTSINNGSNWVRDNTAHPAFPLRFNVIRSTTTTTSTTTTSTTSSTSATTTFTTSSTSSTSTSSVSTSETMTSSTASQVATVNPSDSSTSSSFSSTADSTSSEASSSTSLLEVIEATSSTVSATISTTSVDELEEITNVTTSAKLASTSVPTVTGTPSKVSTSRGPIADDANESAIMHTSTTQIVRVNGTEAKSSTTTVLLGEPSMACGLKLKLGCTGALSLVHLIVAWVQTW